MDQWFSLQNKKCSSFPAHHHHKCKHPAHSLKETGQNFPFSLFESIGEKHLHFWVFFTEAALYGVWKKTIAFSIVVFLSAPPFFSVCCFVRCLFCLQLGSDEVALVSVMDFNSELFDHVKSWCHIHVGGKQTKHLFSDKRISTQRKYIVQWNKSCTKIQFWTPVCWWCHHCTTADKDRAKEVHYWLDRDFARTEICHTNRKKIKNEKNRKLPKKLVRRWRRRSFL